MTTSTATFTLMLPVAADALGRWCEENGASIEACCMLGVWHVSVSKKQLHSYSDERGEHSEHWEVSRHDRDLMVAFEGALRAAGALGP